MVKDDHDPLRERQGSQRVADGVDGQVALDLPGGLARRVSEVGEDLQGAGAPVKIACVVCTISRTASSTFISPKRSLPSCTRA
jgi:hypothetical protein